MSARVQARRMGGGLLCEPLSADDGAVHHLHTSSSPDRSTRPPAVFCCPTTAVSRTTDQRKLHKRTRTSNKRMKLTRGGWRASASIMVGRGHRERGKHVRPRSLSAVFGGPEGGGAGVHLLTRDAAAGCGPRGRDAASQARSAGRKGWMPISNPGV